MNSHYPGAEMGKLIDEANNTRLPIQPVMPSLMLLQVGLLSDADTLNATPLPQLCLVTELLIVLTLKLPKETPVATSAV